MYTSDGTSKRATKIENRLTKYKVINWVRDQILYYYEQKKTYENVKKTYEDTLYDFNIEMERYYDKVAKDNKFEIDVSSLYSGVKKLIVTKVQTSRLVWDIEKLKSILTKEQKKSVIKRTAVVINLNKLIEVAKLAGLSQKDFLSLVNIQESVDDKALDKFIELGTLDEEKVKECANVKMNRPYFKFNEK